MSVHLKAASEAVHIKRQGQALIRTYIEHLANKGLESLGPEDQKFLDLLCPRVNMNDVKKDTNDATEDDEDGDEIVGLVEEDNDEEEGADKDDTDLGGPGRDDKAQWLFLLSFLSHLYSGNYPRNPEVSGFIDRLEGLRLYNPLQTRSAINVAMSFTPMDLVRSVVIQLKCELKRMYKNGTCILHKMVRAEAACHKHNCSGILKRVSLILVILFNF